MILSFEPNTAEDFPDDLAGFNMVQSLMPRTIPFDVPVWNDYLHLGPASDSLTWEPYVPTPLSEVAPPRPKAKKEAKTNKILGVPGQFGITFPASPDISQDTLFSKWGPVIYTTYQAYVENEFIPLGNEEDEGTVYSLITCHFSEAATEKLTDSTQIKLARQVLEKLGMKAFSPQKISRRGREGLQMKGRVEGLYGYTESYRHTHHLYLLMVLRPVNTFRSKALQQFLDSFVLDTGKVLPDR
ncbi:MAG: hypothetical protein OHK0053_32600 [Microscillaceae bacterium]